MRVGVRVECSASLLLSDLNFMGRRGWSHAAGRAARGDTALSSRALDRPRGAQAWRTVSFGTQRRLGTRRGLRHAALPRNTAPTTARATSSPMSAQHASHARGYFNVFKGHFTYIQVHGIVFRGALVVLPVVVSISYCNQRRYTAPNPGYSKSNLISEKQRVGTVYSTTGGYIHKG
jgi:hypothetical protein